MSAARATYKHVLALHLINNCVTRWEATDTGNTAATTSAMVAAIKVRERARNSHASISRNNDMTAPELTNFMGWRLHQTEAYRFTLNTRSKMLFRYRVGGVSMAVFMKTI